MRSTRLPKAGPILAPRSKIASIGFPSATWPESSKRDARPTAVLVAAGSGARRAAGVTSASRSVPRPSWHRADGSIACRPSTAKCNSAAEQRERREARPRHRRRRPRVPVAFARRFVGGWSSRLQRSKMVSRRARDAGRRPRRSKTACPAPIGSRSTGCSYRSASTCAPARDPGARHAPCSNSAVRSGSVTTVEPRRRGPLGPEACPQTRSP